MALGKILALGAAALGAWWLWSGRGQSTDEPPGVLDHSAHPDALEMWAACVNSPGCSDEAYQELRTYLYDAMQNPSYTERQRNWIAERIVELDTKHARWRAEFGAK